jgi:selenophosphate synthetase-related protein
VACVTLPSSALAVVTQMSEKREPKSPSVIKVKNWQKTIDTEERLVVVSQPEKVEQIVDICHDVRFTHSSVRTICDIADRITETAKSVTKVFV